MNTDSKGGIIIKTLPILIILSQCFISIFSFNNDASSITKENNSIILTEESDLFTDDSNDQDDPVDSDDLDDSEIIDDSDGSTKKPESNSEDDEDYTEVSENDSENSESGSDSSEVDESGLDNSETNDDSSDEYELSESEIDSTDSIFSEVDASIIESSQILSESTNLADILASLEGDTSQAETQSTQASTKVAYYYLNTKNQSWSNIDYKQCYYVGKGSVSNSIGTATKGKVKSSYLQNIPEYDGGVGNLDISWDYFDTYNGYYRIYGTVTPRSITKEEKTAFYYLNIRNMKYDEIDYRKCYYVGKGSVIEESDSKGVVQNVTTNVIPEYNDEIGRYTISWDYIANSDNNYNVYATATPVPTVKNEKAAYFYLNNHNQNMEQIDYKKCYYVGKGSVIEEVDYKGNTSVALSKIPDYNGEAGNYIISWEKIFLAPEKDYYMVIASVIKKEIEFDSVEALKKTTSVVEGDIVKTKGYYTSGDGGAAEYTVIKKSNYSATDNRCFKLSNGLYAELNISNNTVCANQLGAYGDGIHDDVVVLQRLVNLGYNITLCKGKTYKFISNALYISNPITLNGNGATIVVDDSYAPQKSDSTYYLIRNVYDNTITSFNLYNINIKVNFSNNRISGREFVVVSPLLISNLRFENVKIQTSKTNNCITCLWIDNGCDSLVINNCKFYNNTSGATGGSLWLTSRKDSKYSEFKSLKNCKITNSYFFSSAGDEVFALWGTGNITAVVSNSTIDGNILAKGKTRIISVVSHGNNGANLNVSMNNCKINANCDVSSSSSYYDSVFGVGTDYPSNKVKLNVTNSTIAAKVYGSLIFPSGYKSEYIARFDANNRPVSINFSKCNINCSSTVTGAGTNYYNTGAEYPASAWDCSFSDCSIKCGIAFAYLYVPGDSKYYLPKIEIDNCDIKVDNAQAFICHGVQSAGIDLNIVDTEIIAQGVNGIKDINNLKKTSLTTQKNAVNQTSLSGVSINGKNVAK